MQAGTWVQVHDHMSWPLLQALLLCFRLMRCAGGMTVAALRADLEPAPGRPGRGPGLRVGCINEQRAVAHEEALLRVQHAHELVGSLLRVPSLQKLVEGPPGKQQAGRLCWQHPALRVGNLALIWGIDGPALQSPEGIKSWHSHGPPSTTISRLLPAVALHQRAAAVGVQQQATGGCRRPLLAM